MRIHSKPAFDQWSQSAGAALLVVGFLLTVSISGCFSGAQPRPFADERPHVPGHVLNNTLEPEGFEAPDFVSRMPLAKVRGGEPSIWATGNGTLFVTFPGCEQGNTCRNGPIYRSYDLVNWTRLNSQENGALDPRGKPSANGDADVAAGPDGAVYASNLGLDGVHFFRSLDGGNHWRHMGNIVTGGRADRQWMTTAGPGHVVMAWMGLPSETQRVVYVRTTFDHGTTWTAAARVGDNIGWLGSPQFDPTFSHVYIPYTEAAGLLPGAVGLFFTPDVPLMVAHSTDGGVTWTARDTGVRVPRSLTGAHWSATLMAPSLDVTGAGHVVLAWSQEHAPGLLQAEGAKLFFVASADNGTTWTKPVVVPARPTAIMPWVTGGGGDRAAISYYVTDTEEAPDSARDAMWDVEVAVIDGVMDPAPEILHSIVHSSVHRGSICSRGGTCGLTQSDRTMLDFFESDVLPDGRIVVTYPVNADQGGFLEIHAAIQDSGTPLFVRRV